MVKKKGVQIPFRKYSNRFKKVICELICDLGHSTLRTAEEYGIALKTLEKWITAYHKDPHCFDKSDDYYIDKHKEFAKRYDNLSTKEMISLLKQQDDEIHSLYSVITSYQIKERMKLERRGNKHDK